MTALITIIWFSFTFKLTNCLPIRGQSLLDHNCKYLLNMDKLLLFNCETWLPLMWLVLQTSVAIQRQFMSTFFSSSHSRQQFHGSYQHNKLYASVQTNMLCYACSPTIGVLDFHQKRIWLVVVKKKKNEVELLGFNLLLQILELCCLQSVWSSWTEWINERGRSKCAQGIDTNIRETNIWHFTVDIKSKLNRNVKILIWGKLITDIVNNRVCLPLD